VPENDAWWGKGFTDWTNLLRAVPRFAGHLQPRIPRDLGFYKLADPGVLRRQIELARGAGLHGFVFYHYWFNGKRLLDGPITLLISDPTLEIPFCVMWANENFTRRWDGLEREILLAQTYRESDDLALIASFTTLFADPRYIRIDGRPLLMIYRASLIPNAARRIAQWRELFAAAGETPLIVMAQSIGDDDPRPYGLDGAVEFPPHKITDDAPRIDSKLDLFDPEFAAAVYDYADIAAAASAAPPPPYPLIKTAAPGWDNDPRREGKGLVLHNATPARYQAWLQNLVAASDKNRFHGDRIVCVNAWNEWAEGAFLEPDIHFGAAFLNATGRAVCGAARAGRPILVLVGHDAHPHGAQLLLLNLARHYARVCGFEVQLLLLGAGRLVQDYEQHVTVTLANDKAAIANFVRRMAALGAREAIVNSAAAARLVAPLRAAGLRTTLLIHEMPKLLAEHNLGMQAKHGALEADNTVFASDYVRQSFCQALEISLANTVILPQGNYHKISLNQAARAETRQRLGIPEDGFLVLAAGFGDVRKGFDLFLQVAAKIAAKHPKIRFAWAGEIQPALQTYLAAEIAALTRTNTLHLPGYTKTIADLFAAADVFALTSREDPYPTVALEAIAAGLPVIAFDESGGIPALLRQHKAGQIAKPGDADDLRKKLLQTLDHAKLTRDRPRLVALGETFSQPAYAANLLRTARPEQQTISACILNYNYAAYLRERLTSVFAQHHPLTECFLLDDASTDDSVELAGLVAAEARRDITPLINAQNSGAVFAQWRRAAQAASGDFVWLAEADDSAAPELLTRLAEAMADPQTAFAFADSQVIGPAGELLAPDYQAEYREAGAALAASKIWPGLAFAREFLSVQNLVFNVSAVLWRRTALLAALARCEDLESFHLAGDWRLYLEALTPPRSKIAFVAAPLNRHRRHQGSTTTETGKSRHLAEVARMQSLAAARLKLDEAAVRRQADYLKSLEGKLK
jgi:glycosyltransferase involved in cell wall biosynthesis